MIDEQQKKKKEKKAQGLHFELNWNLAHKSFFFFNQSFDQEEILTWLWNPYKKTPIP